MAIQWGDSEMSDESLQIDIRHSLFCRKSIVIIIVLVNTSSIANNYRMIRVVSQPHTTWKNRQRATCPTYRMRQSGLANEELDFLATATQGVKSKA